MEQTRVLVVDDELVIRKSLGGWLKRDGYHVSCVSSGEKAIDTMKYNSFDIILLDIQMDGISGMDVLTHVKEKGKHFFKRRV